MARAAQKLAAALGAALGIPVSAHVPVALLSADDSDNPKTIKNYLIVLRGRPTLRSPDGERQLAEGEIVHFAVGPEGTHGMRNDTDEPVRYVVAGIRVSPEVAEYPDTKQITAQARTESQTGERLWFVHDLA